MFFCLFVDIYDFTSDQLRAFRTPRSTSIRFSCHAIQKALDNVWFRVWYLKCEMLHAWCKHVLKIDR